MNVTSLSALAAVLLASLCGRTAPAAAADYPVPTAPAGQPTPVHDWSESYLGFHNGYGWGTSGASGIGGPDNHGYGGLNGGLHAGHLSTLPNGFVVGVEGDITFPNYLPTNAVMSRGTTPGGSVHEEMDYTWSLRARLGYATGRWLAYVTGGLAGLSERYEFKTPNGDEHKVLRDRLGWTVGGGVEYAFTPQWRSRIEYLYSHYSPIRIELAPGAPTTIASDYHTVRVGLTRQFGTTKPDRADDLFATGSDRWEIYGQSTYLPQAHGRFRAPYSGVNSLSPHPDAQATWSNSIHLNARLWEGGELYFNPELLQGFGFDNTVGLGGYSSGEAQKSNFPLPNYNASRLFLRQTFGLGGEQELLGSSALQLSGKVDVSRLTLQIGKFAVTDIFDGNAYAKDPRVDFMNWAMWAPGAFDYAADRVGLTYGATAELNQKAWALRAGYFLIGSEPNADQFDMRIGQRGMYVVELENRYTLFNMPGRIRTIGWLNSAYSGSYSDALIAALAGNATPDLTASRRGRVKYGYALNIEQALTDDVGLFGRWSWNDGKSETMAFTDIDASLSLGVSIKGARWNRPADTIGIGGAINALSAEHRAYIAAGGLGVLIGDGRLTYRNERVFEAYYSWAVSDHVAVTADYQLITNPAYNADRGPVSIFSGRLRGQF